MDVGQVIALISGQPIWLGLLVLAVCSGIEYIVPPFPGDTVTLAGAILIPTAGWPWYGVFAATILGSLVGAWLNWLLGRWLVSAEEHTFIHRWLAEPSRHAKLEQLAAKFEQHGAAYITLNRFIPAFRGLFFIASGVAGLSLPRVLFFGGVSAALWNMALLGVGAAVGYNIDRLGHLLGVYGKVVVAILCVVGGAWIASRWFKNRSSSDR